MSAARRTRLLGLALVLGGLLGTLAVLLNWAHLADHPDATVAFPVVFGLGVFVLHFSRPGS